LRRLLGTNCNRENDKHALCRNDIETSDHAIVEN